MTATVYMIGNAKGGVSKTTVTTMLAFQTSYFRGEKTLVLDLDATPSATMMIAKSANIENISQSLIRGIRSGNLEKEILPITDNLDLIPGSPMLDDLDMYLGQIYPNSKAHQLNLLNELLEPLRQRYDRIFIDLPPNYKYFHESAILASDYCILPMQVQDFSLSAAEIYINRMNKTAETYGADINVVGIVPVFVNKDSNEEKFFFEQTKEYFGNVVVETPLTNKERIKAFSRTGIQVPDESTGLFDKRWILDAHDIFRDIWNELLMREDYFEELKGGVINE